MNDWIIFGLFVICIIEIIFITFRIKFNKFEWLPQKLGAIIMGIFIGLFHLIFLTNNATIGEPIIFYWDRLIYEFYGICLIIIFFIANYLISRLIDKFALGRKTE